MAETFQQRVLEAQRRADSALCVGLDPRLERLPDTSRRARRPLLDFCRRVVDATADLVCAFKPQYACFAAEGAFEDLRELIAHIHDRCPGVSVILDAKRGDIGDTAALYARELFDVFGADAATVNPYLGWDTVEAFRGEPTRGVVVLCHTSNPGSPWLQEHAPGDDAVFLRVAARAAREDRGDLMLVVGATFPDQLAQVRTVAPRLPLLLPGVGSQGADLQAAFASGTDADGGGLVVNAARSVIFASEGTGWLDATVQAATALRDALRRARDDALARR